MLGDGDKVSVGKPLLVGATVTATILANGRHDKVKIFKMRRRKRLPKASRSSSNYNRDPYRRIQGLILKE